MKELRRLIISLLGVMLITMLAASPADAATRHFKGYYKTSSSCLSAKYDYARKYPVTPAGKKCYLNTRGYYFYYWTGS